MSNKPDSLFDQRTVERNIKRGRITRKEYERYLSSLEDLTEKAVSMFKGEDSESERKAE
jgi:hypothetical protein